MSLRLCLGVLFVVSVLAGPDPEWTNSKSVVFLDDETFEEGRQKHPNMMVFFYAPWCGHCKSTKPDYTDASEEVMFVATMAAVDCTKSTATCGKFDVKGYPFIKWFQGADDETGTDYNEGRSSGAFITFIKKQVGDIKENFEGMDFSKMRIKQLSKILRDRGIECKGCTDKSEYLELVKKHHNDEKKTAKKAEKKKTGKSSLVNGMTFAQERRYKAAKKVADEGWEENGDVKHLIDFDFRKHRDEGKIAVMFYAPWCGHCKTLKPAWAEASTEAKEIGVTLAAIDCDTNPESCQAHGATSYPTVLYFPDKESQGKSLSARNAEGIVKFLRKQLKQADSDAEPEKFENEPQWDADSGDVVFMTEDHWDDYRKENSKMWVMFYAPWCGHCKSMKPAVGKASTALKGVMPVVAVDCTEHTGLCGKFGVKGYPTIKYFDSSTSKGEDYNGGRDEAAIESFCKGEVGSADKKEEL